MTKTRRRRATVTSIVALIVLTISGTPSAIAEPTSDVAVGIQAHPEAVHAPDGPSISAFAHNVGATMARRVVVTVELPSSLTAQWQSDRCSVSGQLVTCAVGDLRPGTSASVSVGTRAQSPGDAIVTARAAAERVDTNPGNNVATATTRVYAAPTLEVVDTPDPTPSAGTVTYQVVVRNPTDVVLPMGGGSAKVSGQAIVHDDDRAKVQYVSVMAADGQSCQILTDDNDPRTAPTAGWFCNILLPPGDTTIIATLALSGVESSGKLAQWTSLSSRGTGPSFDAMETEETTILPIGMPT